MPDGRFLHDQDPERVTSGDLLVVGYRIDLKSLSVGAGAAPIELRDLIALERDERRRDHSEICAPQRGELIGERPAAAGRHDVSIGASTLSTILPGTKIPEPEHRAKRRRGGGEIGHAPPIPWRSLFVPDGHGC